MNVTVNLDLNCLTEQDITTLCMLWKRPIGVVVHWMISNQHGLIKDLDSMCVHMFACQKFPWTAISFIKVKKEAKQ